MKISVIGTGYVGLIQAVGLAKIGFKITALDIFEDKINNLRNGIPPIYENGLEEILKETLSKINFTTNIAEIKGSDIIFLCVGTPQDDEGRTDLGYLKQAVSNLKEILQGNEIIIIKSTVPVGTNKMVYELLNSKNPIVSNPEFLREGLAIDDFFSPERIVLGFRDGENKEIISKIIGIYKYFEEKNIAIIETNWQTAELIKYASNSFLATKITFINEIARLSDNVGADIKGISKALGLDTRIGEKFLNAGIGYGGSCFPKDVKSLIHQFKENSLEGGIIRKVDEVNSSQVDYFMKKIFAKFSKNLHGKTIGILGVAFKPDTDDLRESKGLEIIKKLMFAGAKLKIFDYNEKALKNFQKYLKGIILSSSRGFFEVEICNNFDKLCENSNFLVITIEDKKILKENLGEIKLKDNIIFDGRNILDKKEIVSLGIEYIGVGW